MTYHIKNATMMHLIRVCLYYGENDVMGQSESESDIASRWVQRESNLMFTLSNDKDQRNKSVFAFG